MDPIRKRFLVGAVLGLILLWVGSSWLTSEIDRRDSREAFARVQHPLETSLVDTLNMKIEYYPATYVDDSIHFESAYLVGELRSYAGSWDDIQMFYDDIKVGSDIPIMVMPVEIRMNGQRISLDVANGTAFSPFSYDVLSAIQDHYGFWGMPRSLNEASQNLYLVYGVWQ